MNPTNLSHETGFLNAPDKASNINEGFESAPHLAFETSTTGTLMQLDGLLEKNLKTEADIRIENEIRDKPDKKAAKKITPSKPKGELNYEAILGESNNILPIWFLEMGFDRSRSICMIETSGIDFKGRKTSWRGTGFLISENILLTNYHVLNSREVCLNAICIFNYQMDAKGKIQTVKHFNLNPERLFISSPHTKLDFCFVWVEGEPGREFGFVPLQRHAFVVKENDYANIIQHPEGKTKSVALQNNQIQYQNETVVHYTTDTLAGSSGAMVTSNEWKAFALHHATREIKPANIKKNTAALYLNEGIKLSAIATYLESISGNGSNKEAAEVLALFKDTDAMLGYFGGLGRDKHLKAEDGLERVVSIYQGEAKDIDIAFWNIEWFNKHHEQKMEDVGKVIVRMNMDVWVLEESSPQATEQLVTFLKNRYDLDYSWEASEPNAPSGKQTTTILWNNKTVTITKREWSEKVNQWLSLNSTGIENPEDLVLESDVMFEKVDGKIFDRYPGLFYLESKQRNEEEPFGAFIVPLHLKAMAEGSKRRILASRILTAAVQQMIKEENCDQDWILGGDFNATLASEDFNYLLEDFTAISAKDEQAGEMTYIKGKFKSLIDHIFISPNLTNTTASEFIIVAHDKTLPDYLSISDHRPVLIRLSLNDAVADESGTGDTGTGEVADLKKTLDALEKNKTRKSKKAKRKIEKPEEERDRNLDLARESATRDYYNAAADKKVIKEYYAQMPGNISGTKLFTYLSKLVTSTHKKVLAYKPATYLYPWVDLQPDKKTILNIYSGEKSDPESLILADYENQVIALESFQEKLGGKDIYESDLVGYESDLAEIFENSQGFNCEHVVPQSWFNKVNPMKGDLHHLFSCTPNCNSFRGNIPYYEYPDWEERVMDDCGLREPEGFEPKEGKGIVARATLYFLLRYPNIVSQYDAQDLLTLLTWHVNEPPTEYEKHRNVAIQELQGNRNPLIDYPKMAAKIDFTKGLK